MHQSEPLIFEKSSPGRRCFIPPACDVPEKPITSLFPQKMLRKQEVKLPEVSEIDVVRHFTRLSQKNFCVDTNFYPLGSYRSAIFFHSPEQEQAAREVIARLTADKLWAAPIVTQVVPASTFWQAEDYHQEYFERVGSRNPYSTFVVEPKVAKFRKHFVDRLKK